MQVQDSYLKPVRVFIDETGSVAGSSQGDFFYVCTAIIVPEGREKELAEGIRQICTRKRHGSPLKSSSVGGRHELRLEYLRELCALPFSYFALITDKRRLDETSGLRYKPSRYKFIHGKLNQILRGAIKKMELVIDEHGTEEFQNGCIRYFEKHNEPNLFSGVSVRYARDEDEPILQLADFIGGSLLACFDPSRKSKWSGSIRDVIKKHEAGIDFFPIRRMEEPGSSEASDVPDAEKLWVFLNNTAYDFLAANENASDEKVEMQVLALKRLYLTSRFEEPSRRCLFSDDLMRELQENGFQVSRRSFTGEVIGGLRRAGIIISGSPDGYKLALTQADIAEYLNHDLSIVEPMLEKLARAKQAVVLGMNYDILQGKQFETLSRLVSALGDFKLDEYGKGPEPDVEHITMIET